MAFDFPNAPTVGQIVTGPGGIQYQWDGVKWIAATNTVGGPFLPLVGGSLAGPGNLNVGGGLDVTGTNTLGGVPVAISVDPPSGTNATIRLNAVPGGGMAGTSILGTKNASPRWRIELGDGTTESGSNVGSDFDITCWGDGGGFIAQPFIIKRSTGVATFSATPTHPTPPAGDNSTNSATTAFVAPAVQAARDNTGRNYIHNPMFRVLQRATGPWTTNLTYTADRWKTAIANGTVSITAPALTDADRTGIGDEEAQYGLQNAFTGTSGVNDYIAIIQCIEGVRRLGNKTVTLSFWAKATVAGVRLGASIDQNPGTGGSPSGYVSGVGQSVALTTSWVRYTFTFTIGSTAGFTLGTNGDDNTQLAFWYSGGSGQNSRTGTVGVQSGTIEIWGVQVEVGNIATPLAKRDPADELALCQRFYFAQSGLSLGGGGTTSTMTTIFGFPVTMRAPPVMTYNAISTGGSWANPAVGTVTNSMWIFNVTPSGTNAYYGNLSFTASAEL